MYRSIPRVLNKALDDAIVIGSGISGGWAAKEFCEKGLSTLVLEKGAPGRTYKRLSHSHQGPMGITTPGSNMTQATVEQANPLITKAAGYGEDNQHFLFRTKTTHIFRKNLLTGLGVIR